VITHIREPRAAAASAGWSADDVRTRLLVGFDDPVFDELAWAALAGQSPVRHVFSTRPWLASWWSAFERDRLLLVLAERGGQPVALAPLFADDDGMVYFVGSGGSDYLDFIGDTSDPAVLDALLGTARDAIERFEGFRFYHVLDRSPTGARLQAAADRLGLIYRDEGGLQAPALDLASPEGQTAVGKKSLVRHERGFARDGELRVEHWHDGAAILPQLDEFFTQHIERRAATSHPSSFAQASRREFYRRLTIAAADAGWLRFTRISWQNRAIAFHFGFCFDDVYLWWKPTFAIDLAKRSPGEVLLRHLLLAAMDEGAVTFDFGLGDEPFKHRFANRVEHVRTWSLLSR
jgi:CelD/BcsL family acetyltransferase involved in cellulose biosynthesis